VRGKRARHALVCAALTLAVLGVAAACGGRGARPAPSTPIAVAPPPAAGAMPAPDASSAAVPHLAAGDHWRDVPLDGRTRRYLVHVPAALDTTRPVPVVLAFHGGATNAKSMREFSGLDATADARGFLAVYPEGTGRLPRLLTFNAGNCCGYAREQGVDDVAFVRAVLDDLATLQVIDARRVYATGMSNGAMLAHRVGAELADRIAAIAPVAGPLGIDLAAVPPARAVPVMHVHGTADAFAPYAGGQGRGLTDTNFLSVDETVAAWRRVDGCPETPAIEVLPDADGDGQRVTRTTWGPGRDGAEVVLVSIEGGGHTWPGHASRLELLGAVSHDLDVNNAMWEFFERHPLPGAAAMSAAAAEQEREQPAAAAETR